MIVEASPFWDKSFLPVSGVAMSLSGSLCSLVALDIVALSFSDVSWFSFVEFSSVFFASGIFSSKIEEHEPILFTKLHVTGTLLSIAFGSRMVRSPLSLS